ncbi:conserved hypothetical protein [Streptomyces misionensis JCM 4497]
MGRLTHRPGDSYTSNKCKDGARQDRAPTEGPKHQAAGHQPPAGHRRSAQGAHAWRT